MIKLKTTDSQFIPATLNRVFVVPKHVWASVKDPKTFTNSNPVSSGPYNKITRFTGQDYVLSKNTKYWQKGLPKVACLEYVWAASNDAGIAQIKSGQVDWTHNFVQNVEKTYESVDKAHYHAFYSNNDYPISLVFDDTQYPYSLVAFRKAVSLAIDRNSVWKLGEYGYETPADALGLSGPVAGTGLYRSWVTDKSVKAQAKAMAKYDPAAAKKTLTNAGFTYKGNDLIDPKGNPVKLDIHVISGWSDWVASNQIITKNLQAIGIDSNVKLEPDWGGWAPERHVDEEPDPALAGRLARFAVRLLLREPAPERVHPVGRGRDPDRELGALLEREGDDPPQPVEGHARRQEAALDRDAALEDLAAAAPDHPGDDRRAVVDVQHEVLPRLPDGEELLRRSDLHDVPRRHPVVHTHQPGREGRDLTVT